MNKSLINTDRQPYGQGQLNPKPIITKIKSHDTTTQILSFTLHIMDLIQVPKQFHLPENRLRPKSSTLHHPVETLGEIT